MYINNAFQYAFSFGAFLFLLIDTIPPIYGRKYAIKARSSFLSTRPCSYTTWYIKRNECRYAFKEVAPKQCFPNLEPRRNISEKLKAFRGTMEM